MKAGRLYRSVLYLPSEVVNSIMQVKFLLCNKLSHTSRITAMTCSSYILSCDFCAFYRCCITSTNQAAQEARAISSSPGLARIPRLGWRSLHSKLNRRKFGVSLKEPDLIHNIISGTDIQSIVPFISMISGSQVVTPRICLSTGESNSSSHINMSFPLFPLSYVHATTCQYPHPWLLAHIWSLNLRTDKSPSPLRQIIICSESSIPSRDLSIHGVVFRHA